MPQRCQQELKAAISFIKASVQAVQEGIIPENSRLILSEEGISDETVATAMSDTNESWYISFNLQKLIKRKFSLKEILKILTHERQHTSATNTGDYRRVI